MATPVHELQLPEVDVFGLERDEAIRAFQAASEQHWLAQLPLGYAVSRYEDVVAILRDRRFISALSLLPQMAGIDDEMITGRQQQSILAMEGPAHSRLRRLAA